MSEQQTTTKPEGQSVIVRCDRCGAAARFVNKNGHCASCDAAIRVRARGVERLNNNERKK